MSRSLEADYLRHQNKVIYSELININVFIIYTSGQTMPNSQSKNMENKYVGNFYTIS